MNATLTAWRNCMNATLTAGGSRMKLRSLFVPIALALVLSLAACKSQTTSGTGQGTVAGVNVAKQEITLDHGEIPGMMGAMTMTFAVSDPKALEGVAPGAKVEFDLAYENDTYVVKAIRPR
jgi:Cu/Ag efflux protein CusF